MNLSKSNSQFFLISCLLLLLFISESLYSQQAIKGKIRYKLDATPAARVCIELLGDKGTKTISDNTGSFLLPIKTTQKNDSVMISAVGYQSILLTVKEALTKSIFELKENVKSLEDVTVFKSHETIGSYSENVGYYRSWNYNHTGGEIGRIFYLPYQKFKIDKIRFKAGNTCDTCLLRLHIRYMEDGKPGDEMFPDSISVIVNNLSLDSKISEFDLTPYDFTFKEKNFYVGLEVLRCGNGNKGSCAFNFAGTEKGEYLYRTKETSEWQYANDYTIYLKLFLRY